GIASDLCHLGTVTLDQGHCDRARALYGESLRLRQELGDKEGIAYCLEGFAGVAAAQADSEEEARRGARLLGAAEALREAIGAPLFQPEVPRYERVAATLRAALDEATFAAAWAEGRSMTVG